MINIQIGNTFRVRWRVLTNNEEKSFSGRDIRLLLLSPSGRSVDIVATEDAVAPATMTFIFQGAKQKETGVYRLALYENKDAVSQSLTDEILAFRLVPTSSEATKDLPAFGGDPVVTCNTGNLRIGYQGDSAYESWLRVEKPAAGSDTEDDFLAWLRQPAVNAAASALEQSLYAKKQGDYAKEQGDYARSVTKGLLVSVSDLDDNVKALTVKVNRIDSSVTDMKSQVAETVDAVTWKEIEIKN